MKTILIVGARVMQVTLVKKAKELGIRTIVVAENENDPAVEFADKVRFAASDDKEAVLGIAREEKVDGVISNASMYMTTVAYVAEKLGLVGNPVSAIEILEAKIPFRKLQEELGLYAPKCRTVNGMWKALLEAMKLKFPIMVKPNMAAGTQGQTKIEHKWQINAIFRAFKRAFKNSKDGKICFEEFVTNRDSIAIEAEVVIYNGQYLWDGVYSVTRAKCNPLLVNSNIFPGCLGEKELAELKSAVTKIFDKLGVVHGQYNLEGFYTKKGELFILEINPRQGGDEMSKLVEYSSGVDYNRLLVETAVGEFGYLDSLSDFKRERRFIVRHRPFARKGGVFKGLEIASDLKGRIIEHEVNPCGLNPIGSKVSRSKILNDELAYFILEYDSKEALYDEALRLEDLIKPIIE